MAVICRKIGFDNLNPIIWHKISNANYEVPTGTASGLSSIPNTANLSQNDFSKRPVICTRRLNWNSSNRTVIFMAPPCSATTGEIILSASTSRAKLLRRTPSAASSKVARKLCNAGNNVPKQLNHKRRVNQNVVRNDSLGGRVPYDCLFYRFPSRKYSRDARLTYRGGEKHCP